MCVYIYVYTYTDIDIEIHSLSENTKLRHLGTPTRRRVLVRGFRKTNFHVKETTESWYMTVLQPHIKERRNKKTTRPTSAFRRFGVYCNLSQHSMFITSNIFYIFTISIFITKQHVYVYINNPEHFGVALPAPGVLHREV